MLESKIYETQSVDPWWNLAFEEYLLSQVGENQIFFYLWQNQNTIVIGKNQNPWKECALELLEKEAGKLARRISGGGAVFHDLGNLNFSFLVHRPHYDLTRQLQVILDALQNLGISAQFQGRNDLTCEGRKFSGNAFCFRPQSALHHGTILLSADLNKLTRYLQVSGEKIRSKGVDSVRSRVINLSQCLPSLTIAILKEALIQSFQKIYPGPSRFYQEREIDFAPVQTLYQKQASWDWRYGEAPQFDLCLRNYFPWGTVEMVLQLRNATIEKAILYSDAMDEAFIPALACRLEGCKWQGAALAKAIRSYGWEKETTPLAEDIALWLEKESV